MGRTPATALFISSEARLFAERRRIAAFALANRLPAMGFAREFAEDGTLLAYGASLPDLYRRAATYMDRILKGTKPADLPVEQPTKFDQTINLKTAKALGLTIRPDAEQSRVADLSTLGKGIHVRGRHRGLAKHAVDHLACQPLGG
jgi:ABC-type uncharacterized transport system substrate-binding protein